MSDFSLELDSRINWYFVEGAFCCKLLPRLRQYGQNGIGAFPCDESVLKLFYLALMNISQEWDNAITKLESRTQPVYHYVRWSDAYPITESPFTQNSAHPLFRIVYIDHLNSEKHLC